MQLVISVRSVEEAAIAAANGADIVDVKEPANGAMGRASSSVLRAIRTNLPEVGLSAATGELLDPSLDEFDWDSMQGFQFAKVAPAACASIAGWRAAWRQWCANVPESVVRVAVVYADHVPANALPPWQIIPCALKCGASLILFDTFEKRGKTLFDCVPQRMVEEWIAQVHQLGGRVCLAGSLQDQDISHSASCGADLVAFRGAVCSKGREGELLPEKIRALKTRIMSSQLNQENVHHKCQ